VASLCNVVAEASRERASLHLVVAEANTCAPWGGARSRTFFFFFSPL